MEFKNFFMHNEISDNDNKNDFVRKSLFVNFKTHNSFENFLKENIWLFLPNYFLENFNQNQKKLDELNLKKKHVFSSGLHHTNILLKFYIARCLNFNKGFFIIEHGGSFPALDYYLGYENDVSNVIVSWHKKINNEYYQLPAQKLFSKLKIKKKNPKRHYILMNRVTRYSFRCEFYPLTGSNDYLKKFCKVYYDNLNYRISNKTYLKMHPADDDIIWKNYDFYKKISNSKVDKKEGLKKVFENSKLITCLYPETTFAECITNDTPTILLYPKNLYERHDKFLYVINKMKESNIIFFDPVKAALHINNIWNDVDTWWKENKTQTAIKLFKKDILGLDETCKDEKKWFNFINNKYKDFLY